MRGLKRILLIALVVGIRVGFAQKFPVGCYYHATGYTTNLIKLSGENDFQYYFAGCMGGSKSEGKLEKRDSFFVYKAIITDTVLMKKLKASPFELTIKPAGKSIVANETNMKE